MSSEFQVKIASTGKIIDIPDHLSIVEVLWDNNIEVETSCENGLCGTCTTRVLEGEPDHQDMVLDDEEREEFMCVCISRSKSPLLVLDL